MNSIGPCFYLELGRWILKSWEKMRNVIVLIKCIIVTCLSNISWWRKSHCLTFPVKDKSKWNFSFFFLFRKFRNTVLSISYIYATTFKWRQVSPEMPFHRQNYRLDLAHGYSFLWIIFERLFFNRSTHRSESILRLNLVVWKENRRWLLLVSMMQGTCCKVSWIGHFVVDTLGWTLFRRNGEKLSFFASASLFLDFSYFGQYLIVLWVSKLDMFSFSICLFNWITIGAYCNNLHLTRLVACNVVQ